MTTDPRLERFLPLRVLLATPPGGNAPQALIEHSFSMDWSEDRALVFWSGKAYSILGEHTLNAVKEIEYQRRHYKAAKPGWKIEAIDPLDPNCPILIDWDSWFRAQERGDKFGSRNPPFKMKELEESVS